MRFLLLLTFLLLTGCGGGAVVFAPTPPPFDQVPARYDHPSGAFSISVPRQWALYEQNTTTLATAAFSAPGDAEPSLLLAVMNLGREVDSGSFSDLLNRYQTQVRADVGQYAEQSREAMGDGSWRLTGLRQVADGVTESVNTFIQASGTFIGLIEVILPANIERAAALQNVINTFTVHADAGLEPSELTTLAHAKNSSLGVLHVAAWTTPEGVFFITGEIANYGLHSVTGVPVEATLFASDGSVITGAVDTIMGHGIPPGGFAPFSLRFGGGQPTDAATYSVALGKDWTPSSEGTFTGAESLSWTDESRFDAQNRLIISGTVTNTGKGTVRQPRATVTVFDGQQNVIGAAFADLRPAELESGESAEFEIMLPELGGDARNYIVGIQALP